METVSIQVPVSLVSTIKQIIDILYVDNVVDTSSTNDNDTSSKEVEKEIYKEKEEEETKEIPKDWYEVEEYCKNKNNTIDGFKFFQYYNSRNWTTNTGKQIDNWRQMVDTWDRNHVAKGAKPIARKVIVKPSGTGNDVDKLAEKYGVGLYGVIL